MGFLLPSPLLLQTGALLSSLAADGQAHLFSSWPAPGEEDDRKRALASQLSRLDAARPGGLAGYLASARRLLEASKLGSDPFEGLVPHVPQGETLDFFSEDYRALERLGVRAAGRTAFVLVAGGLGERLGYSGIKLALPQERALGDCFLRRYVEAILGFQAKRAKEAQSEERGARSEGNAGAEDASATGAGADARASASASAPHPPVSSPAAPSLPIPIVLMTSDDTDARTRALLESEGYFGADPSQVTLLKQEGVACLADSHGSLALAPSGDRVLTKPHGHGDVHALLHASGLPRRWAEAGYEYVALFQDTNGAAMRGLLAALGVSERRGFDVNSMAVPRRAGEAIGGIARLADARTGETVKTINVEYNVLDPLLRQHPDAFPEGDANDPATGFSPFPGNINQLVFRLGPYLEHVSATHGMVPEFVNPKYVDPVARDAFKSPTRLECMMQDYPADLPPTAKVGFTVVKQIWAIYTPVKNALDAARAKAAAGDPSHGAAEAEKCYYRAHGAMLAALGAAVEGVDADGTLRDSKKRRATDERGEEGEEAQEEAKDADAPAAAPGAPAPAGGVSPLDPATFPPRIAWSNAFALTWDDVAAKFPDPARVSIGAGASLVVSAPDAVVRSLDLARGSALLVKGSGPDGRGPGAVVVDGTFQNQGWIWKTIPDDAPADDHPESDRIAGFWIDRRETAVLEPQA